MSSFPREGTQTTNVQEEDVPSSSAPAEAAAAPLPEAEEVALPTWLLLCLCLCGSSDPPRPPPFPSPIPLSVQHLSEQRMQYRQSETARRTEDWVAATAGLPECLEDLNPLISTFRSLSFESFFNQHRVPAQDREPHQASDRALRTASVRSMPSMNRQKMV